MSDRTGSFRLTAQFGVEPARIFAAWMSSEGHARMTGAPASIDPQVGGRFAVWDGYATGSTLALSDGRRIEQAWRTTDFPDEAPDSRIEVTLTPIEGGTQLVLLHSRIPEGQAGSYAAGWREFYFGPMQKVFGSPGAGKAKPKRRAKEKPRPRPRAKAGHGVKPRSKKARPKAKKARR